MASTKRNDFNNGFHLKEWFQLKKIAFNDKIGFHLKEYLFKLILLKAFSVCIFLKR